MLTTAKAAIRLSAIALGTIVVNLYTLPVDAQSRTADSFNFEEIGIGQENWSFESENETVSLEDEIEELPEYDLSNSADFEVELTEENKRWGNRGDGRDYSITTDVYDY